MADLFEPVTVEADDGLAIHDEVDEAVEREAVVEALEENPVFVLETGGSEGPLEEDRHLREVGE